MRRKQKQSSKDKQHFQPLNGRKWIIWSSDRAGVKMNLRMLCTPSAIPADLATTRPLMRYMEAPDATEGALWDEAARLFLAIVHDWNLKTHERGAKVPLTVAGLQSAELSLHGLTKILCVIYQKEGRN